MNEASPGNGSSQTRSAGPGVAAALAADSAAVNTYGSMADLTPVPPAGVASLLPALSQPNRARRRRRTE